MRLRPLPSVDTSAHSLPRPPPQYVWSQQRAANEHARLYKSVTIRVDGKRVSRFAAMRALVKRIFALRPDSRARVTAELKALVRKGPKAAKKK